MKLTMTTTLPFPHYVTQVLRAAKSYWSYRYDESDEDAWLEWGIVEQEVGRIFVISGPRDNTILVDCTAHEVEIDADYNDELPSNFSGIVYATRKFLVTGEWRRSCFRKLRKRAYESRTFRASSVRRATQLAAADGAMDVDNIEELISATDEPNAE